MKDFRIGTKLAMGFGFMVFLLMTIALLGLYRMSQVQEQVEHVVKSNFVKLNTALEAYEAIQNVTGTVNRITIIEDPAARQAERAKLDGYRAAYRECITKLDEMESLPEGKSIIERMKSSTKEASEVNNRVLDLAMQGRLPEARRILLNETPKPDQEMLASFAAMQQFQKQRVDYRYTEAVTLYHTARTGLLISLVFAVLLGSFSAFMASRSITKPLKSLIEMLRGIAQGEGDLTQRLEEHSKDELGQLAHWFNVFMKVVHDMVQTVTRDGIQVVIGSDQVHAESAAISASAEQLAVRAASIATASEEMSCTSSEIAHSCAQAAEAGTQASEIAASGAGVVRETVQGMNRIAERVRTVAESVGRLGERSKEIGEIVGTIEEIADQTNLLALNAAIEAARAGEQGRGFAVVADEVRALAVRTTKATSEIGAMIRSIQAETSAAVESMDAGVREVHKGSEDAERSGAALDLIMGQIEAVTMQVSQIATAAEEQTATTNEIAGNIQQVTTTAQAASEGSQGSMATSHKLMERAKELMAMLAKFKVEEDASLSINKGKAAHLVFVGNIKAHLDGAKRVDAHALPTHLTCAFGKWTQETGRERCSHSGYFQRIEGPHARVHELGKLTIQAFDAGDRSKAEGYCEEMVQQSRELIGILGELERECGNGR
ncbi:chemotaxis protein [Geomonas sp. Red276]